MLVRDIMRSPAVAISADTMLQDAYRTMQERGIRHLPVVEGEKLVGVITDRDLRLATSALAPSPFPHGSRVPEGVAREQVPLPAHPGELPRLTGFLSHRDLNVHSILTYPDGPDSVRTVLRIGSMEIRLLAQELRRAGFDVLWPPEKPCPR